MSIVAVIIVGFTSTSLFLFYCLLSNHSFSTNPNRITNCFQLFSLCLQTLQTTFAQCVSSIFDFLIFEIKGTNVYHWHFKTVHCCMGCRKNNVNYYGRWCVVANWSTGSTFKDSYYWSRYIAYVQNWKIWNLVNYAL